MRKVLALGTAAFSVAALAATATPAQAVDGTTTVALTVLDGTLAIATTPAATGVNSEIVGTGRVVTSPLGLTTITDTRVASTGWTLSARTTDFAHATSGTIPKANAKFSLSEAPTKVLGTATYTHTSTPDSSGSLAVATASGINTATVLPVLTVTVPADAAAGLYTGTVTQSVV